MPLGAAVGAAAVVTRVGKKPMAAMGGDAFCGASRRRCGSGSREHPKAQIPQSVARALKPNELQKIATQPDLARTAALVEAGLQS
jgi:hypothetical protein